MNCSTAPCGVPGEAQMRPVCASTIERHIAKPMPVPSGFVVKNGLKICSAVSGLIPVPESRTTTRTASPDHHASHRTWPRVREPKGAPSPPGCAAFVKALEQERWPGSSCLAVTIPQQVCNPYQFGNRFRTHLAHHLAAMNPGGDVADSDLTGNLLIRLTCRNHSHHLALTRSERLQ